ASEDPRAEDEGDGGAARTAASGDRGQSGGDDSGGTKPERREEGSERGGAKAGRGKGNQSGTWTETRDAGTRAHHGGDRTMI
ncbi:enolase, partial [Mycobacterium tuberculosis]